MTEDASKILIVSNLCPDSWPEGMGPCEGELEEGALRVGVFHQTERCGRTCGHQAVGLALLCGEGPSKQL